MAGLFSMVAVATGWSDDLPKAETILDKSLEAAGGKAAFEKIKSRHTVATIEMPSMGLKGTVEAWQAPPAKSYSKSTLPGMGEIIECTDGEIAWQMSAMMGPALKEGEEKAMALRLAKFNAEANWRETYKSAETVGVEDVNGRPCYKLKMIPHVGREETQYIDKETYLPAKAVMVFVTAMGEIPVESYPSDYKKVGDITVPHSVKQSMAGQEVILTIEQFNANVDIPKDRFDPTDEIKALLKKEERKPASSETQPAAKSEENPAEKKP